MSGKMTVGLVLMVGIAAWYLLSKQSLANQQNQQSFNNATGLLGSLGNFFGNSFGNLPSDGGGAMDQTLSGI